MRLSRFFIALLSLGSGVLFAQDEPVSKTEELKDSVREWIETMREIQNAEDAWERDRVLLEDQRSALESEIADLTERVGEAKVEKEGAEKESLDEIAKRDALVAANDMLAVEVRKLETAMVERLPSFPRPLADEPRVKELMEQIRQDAALSGKEAEGGLTKRLNNVINLLTEAEKWQQTVHLRDELHVSDDGQKFNMKVVYFGLGAAYAVNGAGNFALVGTPGDEGWVFETRNDLAGDIKEMVDVLNGDVDARFVELPIDLK
ncbi:DUF3450 family protein [Haloferula sp. A504]|uniref:DUF3450 family protein n=1 Tax=Haloferula sp. A504 TaxID=3373601 RepID=UPI0031BDB658|nr:DUF3450 domain-containing protein [Verrucomicrobiaceae bacterium E54]